MAKTRLEGSNPSLSAMYFPGSGRGIRTPHAGGRPEPPSHSRMECAPWDSSGATEGKAGVVESHATGGDEAGKAMA